jgi:hypothetical protein
MDRVDRRQRARQAFLREWGMPDPQTHLGPTEDEAFAIAVTQWAQRHNAAQRAKYRFISAQVVAPVAAGLATILATTSVSRWAVIPSATATIASALLASFGFRETWRRFSRVSRQVGFEIVEFTMGYGPYRSLDSPGRVDKLMARMQELSIPTPPPEITPE